MKVEELDDAFQQITITLETKDEADYLWLLLNLPHVDLESSYNLYPQRRKHLMNLVYKDGIDKMFESLDEIYSPSGEIK